MRPFSDYTRYKENTEKSTFSDEVSRFRRKSRDSGEYKELVKFKAQEAAEKERAKIRIQKFEIEQFQPPRSSRQNPFSF